MPIPTYTQLIPQSGETLGNTRDRIRNNFNAVFQTQNIDHIPFNTTNQGKHRVVSFPTAQASSPGTGTGEIVLYQKTQGSGNALFYQSPGQISGGPDVQLTNGNFDPGTITATVSPASGTVSTFKTFLAGGIITAFGFIDGLTNGILYTVSLPANTFNNFYSIQCTPKIGSSIYTTVVINSVSVGATCNFVFQFRNSSGNFTNGTLYWTAIGT